MPDSGASIGRPRLESPAAAVARRNCAEAKCLTDPFIYGTHCGASRLPKSPGYSSSRTACRNAALGECGEPGKACRIRGSVCADGSNRSYLDCCHACDASAARQFRLAPISPFLVDLRAFGQSGSAGGSIGNDEKSLSGSRESRTTEPQPSTKPAKSRAARTPSASLRSGGGVSFDGAWAFTGTSTNCQGSGTGAFTVSGIGGVTLIATGRLPFPRAFF